MFQLTKYRKNRGAAEGFTLIEVVVVIGLSVGILLLVGNFGLDLSRFSIFFGDSLGSQQEIQQTFQVMTSELQSMQIANTGSFLLSSVSPTAVVFYSDLEGDGLVERVRYFRESNILKKGVIHPGGTPLAYDPSAELVSEVIHDLVASPSTLFTYYDRDFTGSEDPLVYPFDSSRVRVVKAAVTVDKNLQAEPGPMTIEGYFNIRNLRSNI